MQSVGKKIDDLLLIDLAIIKNRLAQDGINNIPEGQYKQLEKISQLLAKAVGECLIYERDWENKENKHE